MASTMAAAFISARVSKTSDTDQLRQAVSKAVAQMMGEFRSGTMVGQKFPNRKRSVRLVTRILRRQGMDLDTKFASILVDRFTRECRYGSR